MAQEEKKHIIEQMLRDMYLLSRRTQEMADDMADNITPDGYAHDCAAVVSYLAECIGSKLCNLAGATGVDLAHWIYTTDKRINNMRSKLDQHDGKLNDLLSRVSKEG